MSVNKTFFPDPSSCTGRLLSTVQHSLADSNSWLLKKVTGTLSPLTESPFSTTSGIWNQIPDAGKTFIKVSGLFTSVAAFSPIFGGVLAGGYFAKKYLPSKMEKIAPRASIIFVGKDWNYWTPKAKEPAKIMETLKDITDIAENAIKVGTDLGYKPKPHSADLLLDLSEIPDPAVPLSPSPNLVEPKPTISSAAATDAIGPQARSEAIDRRAEADKYLDELSHKLTDFATVWYLHKLCNTGAPDTSSLLHLVDRSTRKGETRSIWTLFNSQYKMKWTELRYWKAALFYFSSVYLTSLIPNAIDTYLRAGIDQMRDHLTSKNKDHHLTELAHLILQNASQFFADYNGATKKFTETREGGDLDDHRQAAIEGHYGKDLPKLCEKFSWIVIEKFSPQIPFFRNWKKIPVLGTLVSLPPFTWVEKGLNWIVRSVLMRWILPAKLPTVVKEGLGYTKPNNLPFSLALTKFIAQQLGDLRKKLKTPNTPVSLEPLQESEKMLLSTVVKELKTALDLYPYTTRIELREKFREIEKRKSGIDAAVQEGIEKGIFDACHLFINYLTNPANTEEMFAELLKLSCSSFTDNSVIPENWKPPANWNQLPTETKEALLHEAQRAKLKEDLEMEQVKLQEEADIVFEAISQQGVEKEVKGPKPELAKQHTEKVFCQEKVGAKEAFDHIHQLSQRMSQKVQSAANSPTPENSIHPELVLFSQAMEHFFTHEKEAQQEIQKLNPPDRNAILLVLHPLYEKARTIMKMIPSLQEYQTKYSSHTLMVNQLLEIKKIITSIQEQPVPSLDLPNLMNQIKEARSAIGPEHFGKDAPELLALDQKIEAHSKMSAYLDREQKILNDLYALTLQQGPLDLVIQWRKGIPVPATFSLQNCLTQIAAKLPSPPKGPFATEAETLYANRIAKETKELSKQIDRILKPPQGSTLDTELANLNTLIEQIRNFHDARREVMLSKLTAANHKFSLWMEDIYSAHCKKKIDRHTEMAAEMDKMIKETAQLRKEAHTLQAHPQYTLNSDQVAVLLAILGSLAGFSGFIWPSLSFLGPVVGAASAVGVHNLSNLTKGNSTTITATAGATLVAGAIGSLASSTLGPIAGPLVNAATGAVGMGLAGTQITEQAVDAGKEKVAPEVKKIFKNAYSFILSQHIYRAATTRFMKTFVDSHS